MKYSFTTLACPDWEWKKILETAYELGYQGIEIRGVMRKMNAAEIPQFQPDSYETTKNQLIEKNLSICCFDTSCSFHDINNRENALAEGRFTIDLAKEFNCPFIRVFGNEIKEDQDEEQMLIQIADGINTLAQYAKDKGVTVLVETHGTFSSAANIIKLSKKLQSRQVGFLWDMANGMVDFNEPILTTLNQIFPEIRHVHVKNIRNQDHWEHCLTSQGELPLQEAVQILREKNYEGWLSFEWEKMWIPTLEEPEIALKDYIETTRAW